MAALELTRFRGHFMVRGNSPQKGVHDGEDPTARGRADDGTAPAPDLVTRAFAVSQPNRLWVADITYVWTWAGWLSLAIVLDAFSRKIVGWAMADDLRSELALDALKMAVWNRRPAPGRCTIPIAGVNTRA